MKIKFNQTVFGSYTLFEDFYTHRLEYEFKENIIYDIKKAEFRRADEDIKTKLILSPRMIVDKIDYKKLHKDYGEICEGTLKIKFQLEDTVRTFTIDIGKYNNFDFELTK